jgi:PHD/YefM family antitoxin component YafN of YafNO toxin-antitoxin module
MQKQWVYFLEEVIEKEYPAMAAHEQYVVDPNGKKTAVILSLKRYQELMEDLHDLAVVAERRKERTVSLDEMKRRLKKDGLL